LVAAGPMLLQQWHYLTPDAANVLVGSLVMLAVVRWERSTGSGAALVALAAAGVLAMAVKGPNVVVVVAGALYLLIRFVLSRRGEAARSPRQYLMAAAALSGGAAVASLTWLVVRAALARDVTTPMEEAERVSGLLRPAQVLENVARFVTVWDREPSSVYPLAVITSYLFVGSLLVALAVLARRDPRRALAMATVIVLLAGPLLLVALNFLVRDSYAIVEPRYGTTLVPVQAAIAASLWSGRVLPAVGGLAAAATGAVLLRLLSG
ncbi:MAG: hypothetical protein ACRD1D_11675, partial [Acidimicrobiales bacterium]